MCVSAHNGARLVTFAAGRHSDKLTSWVGKNVSSNYPKRTYGKQPNLSRDKFVGPMNPSKSAGRILAGRHLRVVKGKGRNFGSGIIRPLMLPE